MKKVYKKIEVEDTAEGWIRYKNGSTLSFYGNNNYADDEEIEIRLLCDKGHVKMTYDVAEIVYDDGQVEYIKQAENHIDYGNSKDYWGVRHIYQIKNCYDSVRRNVEPDITGEKVLNTQKLICSIYELDENKLKKGSK